MGDNMFINESELGFNHKKYELIKENKINVFKKIKKR
jgi:hypothetical protein